MSRTEKFEMTVARKQLGYLFSTCMESGYSPWVREAYLLEATPAPGAEGLALLEGYRKEPTGFVSTGTPERPTAVWWGQNGLWENAESLTIVLSYLREEDEEEATGKMYLRISDLVQGLAVMGSSGRVAFGRCVDGDFDGPDADDWLQHVVFGKAVYG